MNYIRKIANSDLLAGIFKLPEHMLHKNVEIIVLPVEGEDVNINDKIGHSVKGSLKKYANLKYLSLESTAWAESVRKSDENR